MSTHTTAVTFAALTLILAFIRAMRTAPGSGPEWAALEAEFIQRSTPPIIPTIP